MTLIEKEILFDLYITQNKSQTEIGKMYGCDRKNIAYYLAKYGIKKSRAVMYENMKKKKPTIDEILIRLENGMLIKDVMKEYGVGRSTIGKILKKNGINLRNHKGQTSRQSERMKTENPFFKEEVKKRAMSNSLKTRRANYEKEISCFDENLSFKEYSRKARFIAYLHFGLKTEKGMAIDHKYSIYDGYQNKVPLEVISKPNNLRMITFRENNEKGPKSIITLDELYKI